MRLRDLVLATLLIAPAAAPAAAPANSGQPFDLGSFGGGNRKDPITITADGLEFDYKANVVTYRGNVLAVQGDVKVKSDVMVIVLAGKAAGPIKTDKKASAAPDAAAAAAASDPPAADKPATDTAATAAASGDKPPGKKAGGKPAREKSANDTPPSDAGSPASKVTLQTVTCTGNVRIDQGTRWATGGTAVFDQTKRTFVLSQKPVLHEAQNEVTGERIIVYLDENRSVVEGGPTKRVQAILYPDKGGGLAGDAGPPKGGSKAESRPEPSLSPPTTTP